MKFFIQKMTKLNSFDKAYHTVSTSYNKHLHKMTSILHIFAQKHHSFITDQHNSLGTTFLKFEE